MHPGMQDPYAAVDPALRQALEAEEASLKKMGMGGRGDITWFKVRQPQHLGETVETIVRFLPPWPGKQTSGFWHKTFTHYIWGEYQGKRVRMGVACPREISKFQNPTQPALPCAVCDRKDQMLAMGDKGGGDQYIARIRFLTNVLDASDLNHHFKPNPETNQMEPVADVMQLGPGLFRSLGKILHQRGDFSSITTGRLVKIFATKVGREARDVRYDALDCSEAIPVPPGFERIRLHDLAALDPIKDYQEVARLLGEPPRSYPAGYGQPGGQGYDPMMHQQQIQPGYNAQGAPMPSAVMGNYGSMPPQQGYGSPQQPPAMPPQQGYGSPQQPPAMPPQQGYGSPQQPPAMSPQQGYGSPQQPPAMPSQQGYGSPQQPPAMPPQQGYGSPQQPPAMSPQQGYGSPQQPPAMPSQQGYSSAVGQGDPPF
jgi:hypothetical protein